MVLEDQITLDFDFDDYEVIGDSLLLTYNGNKEACQRPAPTSPGP